MDVASAAVLDADHAVVAVVYLGLVDQVQLVLRQSIAQILFQLTAAAHLAVDAGDVELVAIARTTLGQGHGLFGFLQQLFGTVTIFREQGDADGGAQAHFVLIEQERQLQVVEYALRQFGGFVGLFDVGLNQGELVAAQTGQCAQAAAMAAQAVGQCEQQLVAALVAELFVDALEVIQADAEHGDAALQAAGIFENLIELLLQLLAVGQAGEEVVLSHAQQAVLGLPAQVVLRSMEASNWLAVLIHKPSSFFSLPLSMGSLCSLGRSGLMLVRCSMIFDSGLVSSQ